MRNANAGLLERTGVHLKQEDGESLAKTNEATKAILDSIGTSSANTKSLEMPGNYHASSGRMF